MKFASKFLLVFFSLIVLMVPVSEGSLIDTDSDSMPDEWEIVHGLNPNDSVDATADLDNDGLSNEEEYFVQHNPAFPDSLLTDVELLELTSRKAFLFFWKEAQVPAGGITTEPILIPDHSNFNGGSPSSYHSIAGIGFALAAIVVADDRGWIDHLDAYRRVQETLKYFRTLQTSGDPYQARHGYLYHFYDLNGHGISEVSSIDHALFIAGVLLAGQYYHGTPIEELANQLYFSTEWNWMWNDNLENPTLPENQRFLRLAWTPDGGPVEGGSWIGGNWDRYSELMILLDLAVGPGYQLGNYFIPSSTWQHISRAITQYGNWPGTSIPLPSHIHAGSLHNHQYSHMFLDLKNRPDSLGYDYFNNSMIATLSNRAFTIDLKNSDPTKYETYDENVWGLSAANASTGYKVLQPIYPNDPDPSPENIEANNDSGTVTPFAALGSLPFTPFETISALRHMYENRLSFLSAQSIWGRYGFLNCFNTGQALSGASPYFSPNVIGIDLGPIVGMVENYRSGLIWRYAHRSWIIKSGLSNMGFNSGPVEPFLIDFEGGSDPNSFGGYSGGFGSTGARSYITNTPNGSSFSIRISGNQAGDGAWIGLAGHSIHSWAGLSFWIRGDTGTEAVNVGLKDTTLKEFKTPISIYHPAGTITNQWTLVTIPFDLFIENGVRLTGMDNISFTFTSEGGAIEIDHIQFIEDAFPPRAPLGFNVQYESPAQVHLNWEANPERDVVGYRIYRKQGNGEFQEIKIQPDKNYVFVTTSYTDTDIQPNQIYTYRITAVDNHQNPADAPLYRGLESDPSPEVTLSTFDQDADGLNDTEEISIGTSPTDPDTDDDTLSDGEEVNLHSTNPLNPDTDEDSYQDAQEIQIGTNPTDANHHPAMIKITADTSYTLYVNGVQVGSNNNWTSVETYLVNLQPGGTVAIKANDTGGIAALACMIQYGPQKQLSDFTWQVSTTASTGWQTDSYDHSAWPGAKEHYSMGQGTWGNTVSSSFDPKTKWIWSKDAYNHNQVYFWTRFVPEQNAIVKVTADDAFEFYKNGESIGSGSSWPTVKFIPAVLNPGDVLGIYGRDEGGIAALIAEVIWKDSLGNKQTLVTDSTWKISTTPVSEWEQTDFDDSGWLNAKSYGSRGVSPWGNSGTLSYITSLAKWIWAADANGVNDLWARKVIPNAVLNITADSAFEIYLNGVLAGSGTNWATPRSLGLHLKDTDVIAIKAWDLSGMGGVLASINYNGNLVTTNSTWKISLFEEIGWNTPEFDDSGWINAVSIGPNGISPWGPLSSISSNAQWIWSEDPNNVNTVYLRFRIGDTNTPLGLTTLNLTADNAFTLYFNGNLLTTSNDWTKAKVLALELSPGDVIAVKATDSGYKAGFLMNGLGAYNLTSDTTWKVLAGWSPPSGWNTKGFNDSGWAFATSYGFYGSAPWGTNVSGFPSPSSSQWIWSNRNQTGTSNIDPIVYFRKTVE